MLVNFSKDRLYSEWYIRDNDGEIEKIDKWGKRRLAYPIKKEHEGFYVLINFKSGSKVPAEITRIARITGGILRHLLAINKNEI